MIPLPFQHTVGRSPSAPPGQRIGSTPILFSCAASLTCRVSWKSSCLSTGSLHLKVASPVELHWLPLFQLCFDSEAKLTRGFGSWRPRESRSPPETGWHSPLLSSGSGVATGNTWKINGKIWVCVGGEHWKKGEILYPGPWNKTKTFVFPWWPCSLYFAKFGCVLSWVRTSVLLYGPHPWFRHLQEKKGKHDKYKWREFWEKYIIQFTNVYSIFLHYIDKTIRCS